MWQYLGHGSKANTSLGKLPSLSLTPEQGLAAVEEETVVPIGTTVEGEPGETLPGGGSLQAGDFVEGEPGKWDGNNTAPHIYFKDLKLLAHDDEHEEEEDEEHEEEEGHEGTADVHSGAVQLATQVARPLIQPDEGAALSSHSESDVSSALASPVATDSSAALTPNARKASNPTKTRKPKRVDRQKLVIILVGLPARGKTFLCNKIMCYFNWLGHPTRHFNVGNYRRSQANAGEVQDATFFDPSNKEGFAARQRALVAALEDMESWLDSDSSQVAIFDATNSTSERRNFLRDRLHGRVQYMFLESICNDQTVLEQNYRLKMRFSPDYQGMDMDAALADFKERIRKYEAVYETITDRSMHYVKLIDMVTGRGHMDVNRISGYIPGKMVFFLMQICKALGRNRRLWLTRHGESSYNVLGKIGGNSGLSARGAAYAHLLPVVLGSRVPKNALAGGRPVPVAVWTSTLERTIATASYLPYPKVQWKALDEIQAGVCDGMTYREIRETMPGEHAARKEDKLRYRYPSGESYMDVIQRLEPVVIEVERERECVCIVAHQAVLRVLYGYFMNKPLEEVPRLEIPLHTLIELVPKADGTMAETRFHIDVDRALQMTGYAELIDEVEMVHQRMPHIEGSTTTEDDDEETLRDTFADGSWPMLRKDSMDDPPSLRNSLSMADLAAAELVVTHQVGEEEGSS